jgi:hypothetical protein
VRSADGDARREVRMCPRQPDGVQCKLGHAGLEMMNRYVHFAANEMAAIQERVSPMDKVDVKTMRVPKVA